MGAKSRNQVQDVKWQLAATKEPEIVVFGKDGCHLCEAVESEIRLISEFRDRVTVVNIEKDSSMRAEYLLRIPVVMVGGKEVFDARMMDLRGEWRKRLPALLKG